MIWLARIAVTLRRSVSMVLLQCCDFVRQLLTIQLLIFLKNPTDNMWRTYAVLLVLKYSDACLLGDGSLNAVAQRGHFVLKLVLKTIFVRLLL